MRATLIAIVAVLLTLWLAPSVGRAAARAFSYGIPPQTPADWRPRFRNWPGGYELWLEATKNGATQ